jgi:hypothetical protein
MHPIIKKTLFWTPRVICILFALFLVIFSFDVFEGAHGFWNIALGLLMHNLPTIALFITLYFAWRREWIGTVIFTGLGVFYIWQFWGRFPLSVYFLIAGPLFLLGILFLVNWIFRAQIRGAGQSPISPPIT